MTCIRRNLDTQNCCNQWQKGIRTINNQYPDDNREFKINAGAGILITPITAGILITNSSDPGALEAGSNIELTPNGDHLQIGVVDGPTFEDDTTINGDLNVNGSIYNQGASYESHMEQVYTTDDYIIMRDNAVTGLSAGSYAGFQVKLYNGVNDGRLVIDNSGTARVGDVGDEQPLLTREESANLNNGALLKWDGVNLKAVDEGSVGTDTKPIKIINGIATAVTNDLLATGLTGENARITTLKSNNDAVSFNVNKDIAGVYFSDTNDRVVGSIRERVYTNGDFSLILATLSDPTSPSQAWLVINYNSVTNNAKLVFNKQTNGGTIQSTTIATL